MSLVTMKQIMIDAQKGKYALGAFEFWSFDSAQAVVEAAEEFNVPVILQAGKIENAFACGEKTLVTIARTVAESAKVPVALHLDHAEIFEDILAALDAGYTSVMYDGSALPTPQNMAMTQKVVEAAKRYGATVEAELGKLAGSEGTLSVSQEEALQTDPDEAADFVAQTGVDALAIAIGTAHGFYSRAPKLNIPRLQAIAQKVSVPLVLHGGSGTPTDQVCEAIANGICKVNICTEFVAAFGQAYIATQAQEGYRYTIPGLFGPSKEVGKAVAREKIKLFCGK